MEPRRARRHDALYKLDVERMLVLLWPTGRGGVRWVVVQDVGPCTTGYRRRMMGVRPRVSRTGEMIRVVPMMWWSDGGWGFGWLLMSVTMVVFWGGLIAVAVWAVRSFSPERPRSSAAGPSPATGYAVEVLAERFARGEIEEEEYARRRAVLHQTRGGS